MKKLVCTKDLSHEEWLCCRRFGLGGSDASVILGINRHRSILQLWEEKTGSIDLEEKETEYQHFGHVMEDIVKKEFERRMTMKVRRSNFILQSEEHPFMLANLDGITRDEKGDPCVFEAKTAGEYKKKEWEEGVPPEYYAQVQHYMAVTGYAKAYVAAVVGGNTFYCHVVERDQDFINVLIAKEAVFWKHVLEDIPPVADGSEATASYLSRKYEDTVPDEIELPVGAGSLISRYDKISEILNEASKEKTEIVNRLKEMLGEHETGYVDGRTVSWKKIQKNSLDTKKVKAALGDDYDDYLTESSYRRFMVA